MGTTRNTTLSLLAAALLLNIAPPALADPICVPTTAGTGACEFQDGQEAAGTYTYDRIIVPAGVTVRATGPLVLQATALIHVAGDIVADPASMPGAPGTSIRLASGGDVLMEGRVVAGDGASAEARELHVASAAGDMGGAGGSVYVSTGPLGLFTLAPNGLIQSGNGGVGGEVRLIQAQGDVPSTTLSAAGGNGGAGGAISIDAITATFHGRVAIGTGGKGGVGYALSYPETLAASPGSTVTATGGDGGAAGNLALPLGMTVFTLHDLGILEGGTGGDGGDGYAFSSAVPNGLYGAEGQPMTQDYSWTPCGGTTPDSPFRGPTGCRGAWASAQGGRGGDGPVGGGKGGAGTSIGGPGGPGGTGAPGSTIDCTYFGPGASNCQDHTGQQGGDGGPGGSSTARGGLGGNGLIQGGQGGDARSRGGDGGWGGKGGKGGRGWVGSWNGALDTTTARTIGCIHHWISRTGPWAGPTDHETMGCMRVDNGGSLNGVCATGGQRGLFGVGEWGSATGGTGGTNALGVRAASGARTEERGGEGGLGTIGDRPVWIISTGRDLCANFVSPL